VALALFLAGMSCAFIPLAGHASPCSRDQRSSGECRIIGSGPTSLRDAMMTPISLLWYRRHSLERLSSSVWRMLTVVYLRCQTFSSGNELARGFKIRDERMMTSEPGPSANPDWRAAFDLVIIQDSQFLSRLEPTRLTPRGLI
jgi:hypothetical protein